MSGVDALLAAIGTPRLDGAKCKGKYRLFVDTADDTRQQVRALRLCHRCPALAQCRHYIDGLPKAQRPTGVVAGRINVPRTRDKGSDQRSRAKAGNSGRQYRRASAVNGGTR